jgi:FkbH-like protein
MERALVRTQLPQVAVPECGSTPWSMLASLRRGLYFPSVSLTKEDLERHQSYKNVAALKMLTREATSLDGFLTGLEMVALHGSIDDKTLLRVTQLINKTNQFNLTTRRYTEEQVRIMSRSSDWWCQWFHIADRFGDHGLIGVILARRGIPSWTVDTWLMSCRVLGRNIEQFMVSVLLKEALNSGATSVLGEFIPTAKNTLVKDLYPRLGFVASPGKSAAFAFDLKGKSIPECSFVMDKSREAPLDEALIYRS